MDGTTLFVALLAGVIGMAMFSFGRKAGRLVPTISGVALMVLPGALPAMAGLAVMALLVALPVFIRE